MDSVSEALQWEGVRSSCKQGDDLSDFIMYKSGHYLVSCEAANCFD